MVQQVFIKYKGLLYNTRKSRRKLKKFKSDINEIAKERNISEGKKSAIKVIQTLYKSREKFTKLFKDYSITVSEAKHKKKFGEGLNILTTKHLVSSKKVYNNIMSSIKVKYKNGYYIYEI